MSVTIQDPVVTVYDLLRTNWTAANTSSITPQFSTGWFDRKNDTTQVTVTNPDEGELAGADGYTAIGADGSGPVSRMNGAMDVNAWAHRGMSDIGSVNPKQLVYEFSEEIKRIIRTNTLTATDLDFVKWDGRSALVETEESPAVFRQLCRVTYRYQFTD